MGMDNNHGMVLLTKNTQIAIIFGIVVQANSHVKKEVSTHGYPVTCFFKLTDFFMLLLVKSCYSLLVDSN